jgi:hypothetical protein
VDTIEFANALIEAERAGALTLTELCDLADRPELRELLRKVAHDEGYWARELANVVKRAGGAPSSAIGDFANKVRVIEDLGGKLALLNRGQMWVVRKIDEQLPYVSDREVRGLLSAMAAAHRANIALVDEALASGLRGKLYQAKTAGFYRKRESP